MAFSSTVATQQQQQQQQQQQHNTNSLQAQSSQPNSSLHVVNTVNAPPSNANIQYLMNDITVKQQALQGMIAGNQSADPYPAFTAAYTPDEIRKGWPGYPFHQGWPPLTTAEAAQVAASAQRGRQPATYIVGKGKAKGTSSGAPLYNEVVGRGSPDRKEGMRVYCLGVAAGLLALETFKSCPDKGRVQS